MLHHDQRDYNVALGETAARFQIQLEETIHKSQASALSVIEKVQNETPYDRIAHSTSLEFDVNDAKKIVVGLRNRDAKGYFQAPMHKHALNHIAERAGIPGTYVNRLLEKEYGPQLLVDNLASILEKEDDKKLLLRAVNGEVRGVLSDSFRIMDSGPIIESFAAACQEVGAVPVEGVAGDLRWALKAVLPRVFMPSTKAGSEELIAFGVQLSNSDFGCGALSLRAYMLRIVCTNYATLEEVLRQMHLGKRLSDDLEFSRETYAADTTTQVLAVRDMVRNVLAPAKINELVGHIGQSLEERVDTKSLWAELPKLGLLKKEAEEIKAVYNDGDVEILPAGNTRARLSNAISWVAKSAPTAEKRLELEQMAGEVLFKKEKKVKQEDLS